jgi:hypothetical protein
MCNGVACLDRFAPLSAWPKRSSGNNMDHRTTTANPASPRLRPPGSIWAHSDSTKNATVPNEPSKLLKTIETGIYFRENEPSFEYSRSSKLLKTKDGTCEAGSMFAKTNLVSSTAAGMPCRHAGQTVRRHHRAEERNITLCLLGKLAQTSTIQVITI